MANNVLKSWLGGFQTPTIAPTPTGYRPSLHPGAGWAREEWLKWWNAQPGEPRMSPFAPGYHLDKKDFDEGSEARKLFPLAAQTYLTSTGRAQRRAEWLRRRQAPTQVLSNYPRLPQSTIPEPKVEYPAPGRPSKYRNPFAWRRPKSSWW